MKEDVPVFAMLKKIESDSYIIFDIVTKDGKIEFMAENELIEYCVKTDKKGEMGQYSKKK